MEGVRTVLEGAIAVSLVGLNFKIVWDWLQAKRNGKTPPEGLGIVPATPAAATATAPPAPAVPATLCDDARVARANTEAIRTEAAVLKDGQVRTEKALTTLTEQTIKNGVTQSSQLEETKAQTVIMKKHFKGA